VSGVTRFGLFVTLDDTGADGIVPRRSLGARVEVDEAARTMTAGVRVIRLGDAVEVRLRQAEVATGSLAFELLSGGLKKAGKKSKPRGKHRRKS
ncbi:MAG: S1 RNA-binding domain-containing protein, partial [Proteobacteria bacterium]|nr:S1 RNA-binding domain-containing protein [Pseudomonadota bacterium]